MFITPEELEQASKPSWLVGDRESDHNKTILDYLTKHPGSTKKEIYSAVCSGMTGDMLTGHLIYLHRRKEIRRDAGLGIGEAKFYVN